MAVSVDWPSGVITVLRSDTSVLTNVGVGLYEFDTDAFRLQLKSLEDDSEGIVWPRTHRHNTVVTISGTNYVRTIEIVNHYSILFLPDTTWTVQMDGASNNNFHDVGGGILNQNSVQVIPANSAGNTVTETGVSGLTAAETADLLKIRKFLTNKLITDPATGVMTIYDDDNVTPAYTGDIYETVNGNQAYRGRGIERREKLD